VATAVEADGEGRERAALEVFCSFVPAQPASTARTTQTRRRERASPDSAHSSARHSPRSISLFSIIIIVVVVIVLFFILITAGVSKRAAQVHTHTGVPMPASASWRRVLHSAAAELVCVIYFCTTNTDTHTQCLCASECC
jgi:heme/copper-type cytochrome/quinol oxidase subunit 2